MSLRPKDLLIWISGLVLTAGCTVVSEEDLFSAIDDSKPWVEDSLPQDGWIQVPTGITLKIWFSEPVEPATVSIGNIHLFSGQDLTPASYLAGEEEDGRGLVVLRPRESLIPGVQYTLRITTRITDLYGNPLEAETLILFHTIK
jgi:hypothetical protein